jgi:hypothetical protein
MLASVCTNLTRLGLSRLFWSHCWNPKCKVVSAYKSSRRTFPWLLRDFHSVTH